MNYEMGGTILSKTGKEKDLGVTMNANMKVSEQCRIAASKGFCFCPLLHLSMCEAYCRWGGGFKWVVESMTVTHF